MGNLYSERRTWLHAVPATAKLFVLALLGTSLFLTDCWRILLPAAAFCTLLFLSLGRAVRLAGPLVPSILVGALLVLGFHALMREPLVGLGVALRLVSTALIGIALTSTTRYTEVLEVFERLLSPLRRLGVRVDRLSLKLALMMRFIEYFFIQWERLDHAHRARTGRSGGFRLLAPMTIHMLLSANRVADALHMRLDN